MGAKYSGEPQRTLHTIQPLGDKLNLTIDNTINMVFHKHAARAIFNQFAEGNDVVLACWEHLNIEGVCKDLGVDKHTCGNGPATITTLCTRSNLIPPVIPFNINMKAFKN